MEVSLTQAALDLFQFMRRAPQKTIHPNSALGCSGFSPAFRAAVDELCEKGILEEHPDPGEHGCYRLSAAGRGIVSIVIGPGGASISVGG